MKHFVNGKAKKILSIASMEGNWKASTSTTLTSHLVEGEKRIKAHLNLHSIVIQPQWIHEQMTADDDMNIRR